MKHLTDEEIKQTYRRLFPRGAYILDESVVLFGRILLEAAQANEEQAVAAEREACAKVCDEKVDAEYATGKVDHNEMGWTQACAIAIRARVRHE